MMEVKLRKDIVQFMRVFERLIGHARLNNNGSLSEEGNASFSYVKDRDRDVG
jgi:hypothetical protein